VDKLTKKGSKIAELIVKGREQGYLTYADVTIIYLMISLIQIKLTKLLE